MSRVYLLRHARAAWAEPGMRDFDRPLEPAGVADADAIGHALREAGDRPGRVICSSARRARETWDAVAPHLARDIEIVLTDQLYITDATGYLNFIRETLDVGELMIIGHNPMIEDLCFALATTAEADAHEARSGGFPAAGLAVIAFPGPLAEAAPGRGHLERFLVPAGTRV
jgi:phosphohistidine phosphatase